MQIYPDHKIISLIEEYMKGSESPDLKHYREQTYERDFANKDRFLWSLKYISKLGHYRNKRILDVGCDCGWHAFTISLLDNENEVAGIDILPSMIEGMSECVETMREKGVAFSVRPLCGDICKLDMEPSSFDAIYSIEAIEHVHDMSLMLEKCFKLIKSGGNLILENDQNMLNRKVRTDTVSMWNKRDHSWEWSEYLRSIRPIEHKEARPFNAVPEEIVRAANPGLEPHVVKMLGEATAGMLKPQIETIAANFTIGTVLPVKPDYDWCRNPLTGEYAERLFDPFALSELLRHAGFIPKVRHF